MKLKLADVALPVPLPQLFTYIIPEQIESITRPGTAVIVPFGTKILTGIVINFRNDKPDNVLKQIIDVVELDPIINESDLKLADWISDYYNTSLGETVKLFLPSGFSQTSKRVVSLTHTDPQLSSLSGIKQKIVHVLTSEPLTIRQLQKKSGIKNIYSVVNELTVEGIVNTVEMVSKKTKAKQELFFKRLSNDSINIFRTRKQWNTWLLILSLNRDEISIKPFLKEYSSSLSILKKFEQKKLISIFQKSVERRTPFAADEHISKSLNIKLNQFQNEAVKKISATLDAKLTHTFLLYGITGSGKTQVYIESIRRALELNTTAIVLIPEISLTPQTVRRFQVHFGDLVVWMHSKMSAGERYDAWRSTKAGKYRIVIGPRSALFAPLKNLGLIIVDEEHESSYKQYDASPRYNARDVALVRAAYTNAVVVLGSATPSIESYSNALDGKYTLLTLPERADHAVLPPITIVNMVEERQRLFGAAKIKSKELGKKAFENLSHSISSLLESKIRDRIDKKEGIILLQNRRGFAPFIECTSCGHVEQCDRCNVTMTYHATKKHMRCHYCGKVKPAPTTCTKCGGFEFSLNGFGTQRVEQEVTALFPHAKILRMDLDTTSRKNSHEKILRQFGDGAADILLGTQMVAKGLDFPRVTLVGVISADTQMMLPDFRSAERTFQLLTQVAGRAGRSTLAGEVIIQTSQPNHYALKHVQDHDFVGFYSEEIEFRRSINYPPFSRVIVVEFKGRNEKNVEQISIEFGKKLFALVNRDFILGPSPAVLSKINNEYRWQIIVKADKATDKNGTLARYSVARVVNHIVSQSTKHKVKIIVDVDPTGIL